MKTKRKKRTEQFFLHAKQKQAHEKKEAIWKSETQKKNKRKKAY